MRLTVTYSTRGRHRKVGCSLWPQSANTRLMSFCSRSSLNNKRNPSTVWRRCLLLFASILMLPGCTYSTNPIFVEQDNLFDEAFLGTWEADEEAKLEFRRFEVERWGPEEKNPTERSSATSEGRNKSRRFSCFFLRSMERSL